MKPLFVFRPQPGWSVTAETARAMGLEVRGNPLFTIEPVDWEAPEPGGFDGLLVGSANVFRHGGRQLAKLTRLPVHAVGDATADAARSQAFLIGQSGRGGLQVLVDAMAGRALRLLRLAGEDRVALRLPEGMAVETKIVYRAVPTPIDADNVAALEAGGVIVLHSGAAAKRLVDEFDRLAIDRDRFDCVVIGPRVADCAGDGWRSLHVAATPDDGEMLALAKGLCQTTEPEEE